MPRKDRVSLDGCHWWVGAGVGGRCRCSLLGILRGIGLLLNGAHWALFIMICWSFSRILIMLYHNDGGLFLTNVFQYWKSWLVIWGKELKLSRTVLSAVVTFFITWLVVTFLITWLVVALAKLRSRDRKGKGKGKAAPRDGGGYTSNLSGWHEETQRSVAQLNNWFNFWVHSHVYFITMC